MSRNYEDIRHREKRDMGRMRKGILSLAAAVSLGCSLTPGIAASQDGEMAERERLHAFLQSYGREQGWDEDEAVSRRITEELGGDFHPQGYAAVFADLNEDGRAEAVVRLDGDWCGATGGCRTLIFSPEGDSYRYAASFFSWLPIRVLSTGANGWRDLSVWLHDGAVNGYVAVLPFDGESYPFYPSDPPARRSEASEDGEIIISYETPARRLFD